MVFGSITLEVLHFSLAKLLYGPTVHPTSPHAFVYLLENTSDALALKSPRDSVLW